MSRFGAPAAAPPVADPVVADPVVTDPAVAPVIGSLGEPSASATPRAAGMATSNNSMSEMMLSPEVMLPS